MLISEPSLVADSPAREAHTAASGLLLMIADGIAGGELDLARYEANAARLSRALSGVESKAADNEESEHHSEPAGAHGAETDNHVQDIPGVPNFDRSSPPTLATFDRLVAVLGAIDEAVYSPNPGPSSWRLLATLSLILVGLVLSAVTVGSYRRMRTRFKENHDRLRQRAVLDELTGLLNRAQVDLAAAQVAAVSRFGMGVIYVDLDGFKQVNDSFGHHAGDCLLAAVGQRITGILREPDRALRLGGDEFLVLIADVRSSDELKAIGERLLVAVTAPFIVDGAAACFGASAGAVFAVPPLADISTRIRDADAALYAAKRAGRGRVVMGCSETGAPLSEGSQIGAR